MEYIPLSDNNLNSDNQKNKHTLIDISDNTRNENKDKNKNDSNNTKNEELDERILIAENMSKEKKKLTMKKLLKQAKPVRSKVFVG